MNLVTKLEALIDKITKREKILLLIAIFVLSFAISLNQTLTNAQYNLNKSMNELLETKNILDSIIDSNITTTDVSALDNEIERLKQEIHKQNQQIQNLHSKRNEISEIREICDNLNIDSNIEKQQSNIYIRGESNFQNIMELIESIEQSFITLKIEEVTMYPNKKEIIFNITITLIN